MTASQIAKRLHGRKFGKGWMCRCPCPIHRHGDRNRSLSVREMNGWVRFKCFTGCERDEILAALGLSVKDLALNELRKDPAWEQHQRDSDRRKVLIRRHGLSIMAQAVLPKERNYWAAVERNLTVEIRQIEDRLFPEKAACRIRNEQAQRIIAEYGLTELWECIP